ncbi:MAG: CRISPR system precrRNA processing endoribonuclease RAMP protein Cas6 [Planctomycetota bacterium]|jgi:hypothetical protein|nr:CRISPR system precrRNA processing endoribonuclease RAMP protein Cas6 [Planctomycetota bacterium]
MADPDAGIVPVLRLDRFVCEIAFRTSGRVSRRWGQTLRGGFGLALRRLSCSRRRETCGGCALFTVCPYSYLFETPVPPASEVMRLYPHAPHPLIIESPDHAPGVPEPGTKIRFSFILIGKALEYLPYVALAFQDLGAAGLGSDKVRYDLLGIFGENGQERWMPGGKAAAADGTALGLSPGQSRHCRFSLRLVTPLRIQTAGRINRAPDLPDIAEALARRIFLLRYFYGDGYTEILAPAYRPAAAGAVPLERKTAWNEHRRHSTRQQRDIPVGGVTGWLRWEGDFGVLEPLFRLGEYVHVGKNALFGLGRILASDDSL